MAVRTRVESAAPPSTARAGRPFRGDVDGLRAIAIVLVVAFHVGLPRFGGGFIGVDVFFVISGFLITRNLLSEVEATRHVRLLGFWGGRIRRLVPALSLMVAATLVASLFVLPRINWQQVATQGGAAALYVSNLLFARDASDYFAADINKSPFLHTWSLGVEEQFYLLWPLLFAGVCWLVARRARRQPDAPRGGLRRRLVVAFVALFAVSFIWNIRLSASGSSWAFFGLPTRAWEFAAAGLLAAIPLPRALHARPVRTAIALGGLGVLALAVAIVKQDVHYPGWAALLPVVATMLVVASGDSSAGSATPVGRVLAFAPMQWVGRVSYSWYLWHWPFIVLLPVALGRTGVRYKLIAALISLPVAYGAHRLVENPLRFSRKLIGSKRLTYGFGALATVGVLLIAGAIATKSVRADSGADNQSLDARVARARAENLKYECNPRVVGQSGGWYCVSGKADATRTVMMIGDSHALHWKKAMARAADALDVRLVDRQLGSCPAVNVSIAPNGLENPNDELCPEFRRETLALIAELHPDVVIVSDAAGYGPRIVDTNGAEVSSAKKSRLWQDATHDLLVAIRQMGSRPVMVVDSPNAPYDTLACVSKHQATDPCDFQRAAALKLTQGVDSAEEKARAEVGSVPTFSVRDVICPPPGTTCHVEVGGALVYADAAHLTVPFTTNQVPTIEQVMRDALNSPAPPR